MFTIPELRAGRPPGRLQPRRCPHCAQAIDGLHRPVVVATRNCPGCGRRVVEEPEPAPDPPPFTPQQIEAAEAEHARTVSRVCRVIAAVFLAWFAFVVVVALYRDTIRDAVRPFVDPQWIALLIVLPLAAGGVVASLMLSRSDRAAVTKCPSCSARLHRLFAPLVRVTGNCWVCGRRVLTGVPPDESAGPLPSVAEFKASAARLARFAAVPGYVLCALILAAVIAPTLTGNSGERLWQSVEDRDGSVRAAIVVSGLITAYVLGAAGLILVASRLILRWHRKRAEADPVLNCPHCRAPLTPSPQVIAGRRCLKCGRRVLADPEPAGVAADAPAG